MAKQHMTDQELERDEVAESLGGSVEWARAHSRGLTIGAILVVLAFILGLIVNGYLKGQRESANALLSAAITSYERLGDATDDQARKEAEDLVMQKLNALIDSHGDSGLGNEARFLKAKVLYNKGEFEQARKLYGEYTGKAGDNQLRARGEIATAYAFENESFLTTDTARQSSLLGEALTYYQRAQQSSPAPSFLYFYARMGQARYHELQNQRNEAIAIYEQVMKDRPAPVEAVEEKRAEEGDSRLDFLRDELNRIEKTFSLAETARLRLERLRAQSGATTQTQQTVVTTTP